MNRRPDAPLDECVHGPFEAATQRDSPGRGFGLVLAALHGPAVDHQAHFLSSLPQAGWPAVAVDVFLSLMTSPVSIQYNAHLAVQSPTATLGRPG